MKSCSRCFLNKPLNDFYRAGKYKNKIYYRPECKLCISDEELFKRKQNQKKYRTKPEYKKIKQNQRNKKLSKLKEKEYYQRPEVKKRRSELAKVRARERYKTDTLYRLKTTMRARLYEILTRYEYPKRGSIFKYIDCDIYTLKQHIELQFKDGMNWENYGTWHIDHIVPLASAKNEEELIKLFHYTNLQPLWAIDNLKKSDKI